MKKLLVLVLVSFAAHASNWAPHSKIKAGSSQAFQLRGECERVSGEVCYDMGAYPSSVYSEVDVQVDDHTKPIYDKQGTQACADIADCDAKHPVACDEGYSPIKNYDLLEVYCIKLTGYDQKTVQVIELDNGKLATWQAEQDALAVQAQEEAAIKQALKDAECGRKVIAMVRVRNIPKNLSKAQQKAMQASLKDVNAYLQNGSLALARDEVAAVVPDGTVIQQGDKDAALALLDECLGAQ